MFAVYATHAAPEDPFSALKLGAHRTFSSNQPLPQKVRAVMDNMGPASWAHSMSSLSRGGTLVMTGGTTGFDVPLNLLRMIADQLTVTGSIVNQVARIEELCKRLDKPVLATAPVAELLPGELVPLGSYPLRGVATPLEVFTLPELA